MPTGQATHWTAPPTLYVPAAHAAQSEAPAAGEKEPAGQGAHDGVCNHAHVPFDGLRESAAGGPKKPGTHHDET